MSCRGFLISVLSRFSHDILAMELMNVIGSLEFEWLFLNTNNEQIIDKTYQTILTDTIFTRTPTLVELTQAVHFIMHAIVASRPRDEIIKAQLSIVASIFQRSKSVLPVNSLDSLKEFVFVRPGVLKDLMMATLSNEIVQGNLNLSVARPFSEYFRHTISV